MYTEKVAATRQCSTAITSTTCTTEHRHAEHEGHYDEHGHA